MNKRSELDQPSTSMGPAAAGGASGGGDCMRERDGTRNYDRMVNDGFPATRFRRRDVGNNPRENGDNSATATYQVSTDAEKENSSSCDTIAPKTNELEASTCERDDSKYYKLVEKMIRAGALKLKDNRGEAEVATDEDMDHVPEVKSESTSLCDTGPKMNRNSELNQPSTSVGEAAAAGASGGGGCMREREGGRNYYRTVNDDLFAARFRRRDVENNPKENGDSSATTTYQVSTDAEKENSSSCDTVAPKTNEVETSTCERDDSSYRKLVQKVISARALKREGNREEAEVATKDRDNVPEVKSESTSSKIKSKTASGKKSRVADAAAAAAAAIKREDAIISRSAKLPGFFFDYTKKTIIDFVRIQKVPNVDAVAQVTSLAHSTHRYKFDFIQPDQIYTFKIHRAFSPYHFQVNFVIDELDNQQRDEKMQKFYNDVGSRSKNYRPAEVFKHRSYAYFDKEDKKWTRVRVRDICVMRRCARVDYIDVHMSTAVSWDDLLELDASFTHIPPEFFDAKLSYIAPFNFIPDEEVNQAFQNLVHGKVFNGFVVGRNFSYSGLDHQNGLRLGLVLTEKGADETVQHKLIKAKLVQPVSILAHRYT